MHETVRALTGERILPNSSVAIVGSGIGGPVFALELIKKLGFNTPYITIVDRIPYMDYANEERAKLLSTCKGCAGGVSNETLTLLKKFDPYDRLIIDEEKVFLRPQKGEKQILSLNVIKELRINLPGFSPSEMPVIKFSEEHQIRPTYRSNGPRHTKRENRVGLNSLLTLLLKDQLDYYQLNRKVTHITGEVADIDITSSKPKINIRHPQGHQTMEPDLVVLTSGITRGAPIQFIVDDEKLNQIPITNPAYMMEIQLDADEQTIEKIYGAKRQMANVIINPDPKSPIHFVFFLPQYIETEDGIKTFITVAIYGKKDSKLNRKIILDYIKNQPIDYLSGAKEEKGSQLACECQSAVPMGPVGTDVLKELAKKRVIGFGDRFGTARLQKNGIGTIADQAIMVADLIVGRDLESHYLEYVAESIANDCAQDNIDYGVPFFDWLDHIFLNPIFRQIVKLVINIEKRLPADHQKIHNLLAQEASGTHKYQYIVESLRKGMIGNLMLIATSLLGIPFPKTKN